MKIPPAPILETDRLILRSPIAEDFDAWAAFASDQETMRNLGGVQARSVAWRGMCSVVGAWQVRGFSMFSVIEKASGRWIGRLGPWQPEGWPGTEVVWGLVRDRWGRGYATEGASAVLDYAFNELGWSKAIHIIAPDNAASQAVATRLGATLEGPTRMPPPYDQLPVELWSQTRETWRARRRSYVS